MRTRWPALRRRVRIASNQLGDFLNIPLYYRGGWLDVRLVDALIAAGGVGCVVWYYFTLGWLGALQGGMLYLFITLCALWFFRSDKEMK